MLLNLIEQNKIFIYCQMNSFCIKNLAKKAFLPNFQLFQPSTQKNGHLL
ncbi:hypothetical protein P872_06925 [Rhodonellum psychrophilum GCM71 = DSM 17998]|uniref:Uncharacterized protein n=2 Tax=Rhodonellum TaxID=336827 RepID=U5BWN9_9BACT|nr:hypothetical protein P872_06925 [Rhodonellum psychrophilum GCM71 = DSM 17998]SDY69544.1 hypothetical protein SAMN05444412_102271 [Rhodonellum ikkaensis]